MEDILKINKDGTQRLIKPDAERFDRWYDDVYVIFYKGFPVYVEVDRLVIDKSDWRLWAVVGDLSAIKIDTPRIKVENKEWRWYKFWLPTFINYTKVIPF